jgi:hypothetical protein
MRKVTPFLANGCPKLCFGCGKPFVVRRGRAEAIVGLDGRLYCYANGCDGEAFVPHLLRLKRAS